MIVVKKYHHTFFPILAISFIIMSSCGSKQPSNSLFEIVPAEQSKIDFENKLDNNQDRFNILYYLYYYNGGGVATGDINGDGLVDIYFTANRKGNNKLYLNKGNFVFEDITTKAGVGGSADWCTGVTMADINADGFLDIYVTASSNHHGLKGNNELFINNGNGTFSEKAAQYQLNFAGFGTQAAFFDYDKDGDIDCYLLNHSQKPHANIVDASLRSQYDSLSGDRLYRNDIEKSGQFTDVSKQAGIYQSSLGYGLGIAVADINNDGWDDIYIGNDFHENDYYYVNNKDGTFSEEGSKHFQHYSRFSMGNDVADYNNDGHLDLFTVDMLPDNEKILKTYGSDENADTYKFKLMSHGYQHQYSKNCLQKNNGNGTSFSEVALQAGVSATDWSWSPLFADFDNDGKKDLFISSGIVKRPVDLDYIKYVSDLAMKSDVNMGASNQYDKQVIDKMPDGASHPYFYKGDGKFNFKDVSKDWGTETMNGYFNGAAYADLNNDGNLDIVINCINAKSVILKNKAPAKLTIDFSCIGNDKNTFGIGTKVWTFSKENMQYQQLMPTRGFQSSCDYKLHFGFDSIRYIDSVLVVWPNQKYQVLKNIPAKGFIELKQSEAGGQFEQRNFFANIKRPLVDITNTIDHNWQHTENDFWDFNKQYLIPHQLSTRGPKIAIADVNSDGLDDYYVCGALNQSGQLYIQNQSGKFSAIDTGTFNKNKASEEVDAAFFDADNDGDIDLYVTTGGNQFEDGNQLLIDFLYLNKGNGQFIQSSTIPSIKKNKSCVIVSDIDKDGDKDLFVGGLANANYYSLPQDSYLLINDGKANFTLAQNNIIELKNLGMVTGAAFADINNDQWDDLIVTGEWMPIKIFINKKGNFTLSEIEMSTGLWQTVFPADVNGDGFTDLLAGNWGKNTKYYSAKEMPLKMYVKDFDKNGAVEQIVTYTLQGKEYTFLAKDELERSLPVLKKHYLTYSEVAGKDVQYMFYDLFEGNTQYKAEVLTSSYFINNGKGSFTRIDLPDELQMAPLFTFSQFTQDNQSFFVGAGNFYGVVPYEGRYDALMPTVFSFNKLTKNFAYNYIFCETQNEVRDIKWLKYAKEKQVAIVAKNNGKLQFLELQKN